jgi:hypothetical protein
MAESAAQGGGLLYHRQPTVFPPGYPALVALLVKLNLAHVWLIIGMNVGFLMAGLLAVRSILYPKFINERSFASGICIFSLLSFVPIKYSAIPLTDPPFFGVAMCCLALMESAAARLPLHKALAGTILVIVAICTRWIGIALIPALLWMVLLRPEVRRYFARSVRTIAAAALFAALGCLAVAWLVYTTSTLRRAFQGVLAGHTIAGWASGILAFRLKELGEITINLPFTALSPAMQRVVPFAGAAAAAFVCAGLISRRRQFAPVDVFFVSYASVILVWPYYDPRFWLPVLPLFIAYAALPLRALRQHPFSKAILRAYAAVFAMLGILALGSNTSISWSRSDFADAYPGYHSAYCAAGYCKGSDLTPVDQDALRLLREFR